MVPDRTMLRIVLPEEYAIASRAPTACSITASVSFRTESAQHVVIGHLLPPDTAGTTTASFDTIGTDTVRSWAAFPKPPVESGIAPITNSHARHTANL